MQLFFSMFLSDTRDFILNVVQTVRMRTSAFVRLNEYVNNGPTTPFCHKNFKM